MNILSRHQKSKARSAKSRTTCRSCHTRYAWLNSRSEPPTSVLRLSSPTLLNFLYRKACLSSKKLESRNWLTVVYRREWRGCSTAWYAGDCWRVGNGLAGKFRIGVAVRLSGLYTSNSGRMVRCHFHPSLGTIDCRHCPVLMLTGGPTFMSVGTRPFV